ncbi:MAG: 2-oxo acid dehydrogenase subunit E2 [Cryomorphaceae bacterium]|nr:2-oxo acid dehydrogenase subunit E2 [Cryomorphaceae bacterium]
MAEIEIRLPKMGESVTEATITNWLKNIGDSVALDEPLVEVATDKVDNELPSEAAGTLIQILFEKDQVAQVGDVIAILSTEGGAAPAPVAPETPAEHTPIETTNIAMTQNSPTATARLTKGTDGRFYSPLVRTIAQKENINSAELSAIQGTGQDGRVTKKDILSYLETRGNEPVAAPDTAAPKAQHGNGIQIKELVVLPNSGDEIIEMDRMRKLIAEHMVMSVHVSPHVTSYVEADVTTIVKWRERMKNEFKKREGENLTYTPIFIEAVAKAIKDFPMINVSVSGTNIIKRKDINIGMAAALPSGNLIVPVIKNADRMNLNGLAKAVNELANNARNNKLKPEDIQGGTYTVTNVGTFGNVMGTPIINQPQVAILALGAIRKVPAVIETPEGDFIGIRHKMFLSHSYDHRVVDGALGGQFVRRVADYLEGFDPETAI